MSFLLVHNPKKPRITFWNWETQRRSEKFPQPNEFFNQGRVWNMSAQWHFRKMYANYLASSRIFSSASLTTLECMLTLFTTLSLPKRKLHVCNVFCIAWQYQATNGCDRMVQRVFKSRPPLVEENGKRRGGTNDGHIFSQKGSVLPLLRSYP